MIPVCLKDGPCEIVPGGSTGLTPAKLDGAAFFYANARAKGYYRTEYGAPLLAAVAAHVESGLTAPERVGLLGDQWALMRGGEGSVGEFLDLALAVKQDPNAVVVDMALGKMEAVGKLIATDADRERLDAVVRREFGPVYAAMGAGGEARGLGPGGVAGVVVRGAGQCEGPCGDGRGGAGDEGDVCGAQGRVECGGLGDRGCVDDADRGEGRCGDVRVRLLRVAKNTTDPDLKTVTRCTC